MKYTYYPGCSLHSTAEEYNASSKQVLEKLGIQLEELKDWNCCGATSAHSTSDYLAHALPLRNLVLAEKQDNDVLVPCAACYNLLKTAEHHMRCGGEGSEELNLDMQEIMGAQYQGNIAVRHVVDVFAQEEISAKIAGLLAKPLAGLKVVPYYGCLLTRPAKVVSFEDNAEQPQTLDRLLGVLGAENIRWSHKTECCGGSFSISQPDLVLTLTKKLVDAAQYAGADAIVTACPLCQANLDTRQHEAGGGPGTKVPVFYITELIGLAIGAGRSGDWLKKHLIDPVPLLRSLNLLAAS
ncbi:CoB--CoM heterodisulfide reductase iron-sulfur subunit B family protein [Metallumcola ferriviriculae]|uniref:CoB--CoM heterodisulfide reductase iron-sulfur subunit B family protein n=1 Tax=Metallumcola ferriviriculae TaxID=3039180 RepID=A0AAU0UQN7_9FIRM|nr:CoB--CoM heterodisulfide reductase iron-sulfur subunit B family protein [Desulfitibacteraceae bacterium MK1]